MGDQSPMTRSLEKGVRIKVIKKEKGWSSGEFLHPNDSSAEQISNEVNKITEEMGSIENSNPADRETENVFTDFLCKQEPETSKELKLKTGDIILIGEPHSDGWWYGEVQGENPIKLTITNGKDDSKIGSEQSSTENSSSEDSSSDDSSNNNESISEDDVDHDTTSIDFIKEEEKANRELEERANKRKLRQENLAKEKERKRKEGEEKIIKELQDKEKERERTEDESQKEKEVAEEKLKIQKESQNKVIEETKESMEETHKNFVESDKLMTEMHTSELNMMKGLAGATAYLYHKEGYFNGREENGSYPKATLTELEDGTDPKHENGKQKATLTKLEDSTDLEHDNGKQKATLTELEDGTDPEHENGKQV